MLERIIHNIIGIADEQPNVNTAAAGNIYELMNTTGVLDYSVFALVQNTHQEQDGFMNYSFTAFYIDRLTDDRSNEIEIQSTGIAVLRNIIMTIEEEFDWDIATDRSYNTFTERFTDETAGVFTTVEVMVPISDVCAEIF